MRFPNLNAARKWLDEVGGDIDYDRSTESEVVIAFVFDKKGERVARQFEIEAGLQGAAREAALEKAEKAAIEALGDALAGED